MLNLGLFEILVIVVLAIVVVGPDRLPGVLRMLGRQYGKLLRASEDLRRAFMLEVDREEAAGRAEELRRRREEARKRAAEARARALEGSPGQPVPRGVGLPLDAAEAEADLDRALAAREESAVPRPISELNSNPEAPSVPEPPVAPPLRGDP